MLDSETKQNTNKYKSIEREKTIFTQLTSWVNLIVSFFFYKWSKHNNAPHFLALLRALKDDICENCKILSYHIKISTF